MKYFKKDDGSLYVDPIVSNHEGLVEITEEEFTEATTPTSEELSEQEKQKQIQTIRAQFMLDSEAPVEVNGVLYNGGNDSARDIHGAVILAEALGETSVLIAGYDNVAREMTFEDALNVSAQVGKSWRTAYFTMQEAKVALG